MVKKFYVTKRNGLREPYQYEKVQRQIEYACHGIGTVSQSMIEVNMNLELFDGITTAHIDRLAENSAVKLIVDPNGHTDYQYVAGRLKNSSLRKEVYGQFDPPHLFDIVKKNVEAKMYTHELLEWYSEAEWNQMNDFLDHSKDENYSHAAISQLADKYLVKNKSTGQLYETPQIRYIVAAATDMQAEKENRMDLVREYYETVSDGIFSLATPVLAGLGTPVKQFSSCVLIKSDDTLDSIFASGEMMAKYASNRAGIGLEIGRIRAAGSPIRNGQVSHTGLVPFIKKWYGDLRCCSQGGIRNASATLFYPVWHYDFEELIVLKNDAGTEETRCRHLDYGVVTCTYLWNRFKNRKNVTLFDPNDVPDLYEAYYSDQEEFVRLYEKYEKDPSIKKKNMASDEIFQRGILKERADTSRIYLVFVDNVIKQGPIDSKAFPIYQSNLCVEILIPTVPFQRITDDQGRIALCTLGSINWGKFKKPEQMRSACHLLVRSLNNILEYQTFLSPQAYESNEDFRPLGVGVTNLAFWHAKRHLKYGSPEALAEVKRWMEHLNFYCIEASVQLAKERGPCREWRHTSYADGIFPWENRAVGVNELTDFTPSENLDWEGLREDMVEYGVRNALHNAIAPVESSSVAIDSTNGINLPKSLIVTKESKGGSLTQVVPEYEKLKNRYQTLYGQDFECRDYLKTAAVLAVYTDQSISTDTPYDPGKFPEGKVPGTLFAQDIMLAQKWGLKTLYYNVPRKTGVKDQVQEKEKDEDCEACKL